MKTITPFEKRMRLVFGLIFSVILGTIAVSILVIDKLSESLNMVAHTQEVMAAVNATQVEYTLVRFNGKNFFLTRQPKHLAMRQFAIIEFHERMSQLTSLTADNPRQQANIKTMDAFSEGFYGKTGKFISRVEKSQPTIEEFIEYTDMIEAEALKGESYFQMMRDEESRLLTERQKTSINFVNQAFSVFPIMLIVQGTLVLYIYYGVLNYVHENQIVNSDPKLPT